LDREKKPVCRKRRERSNRCVESVEREGTSMLKAQGEKEPMCGQQRERIGTI
jgi:hypothetical protein